MLTVYLFPCIVVVPDIVPHLAGGVFASPNTDSVAAAIEATASKSHGAVLVVLQYTGDRLCFGAAAAIARAKVCVHVCVCVCMT